MCERQVDRVSSLQHPRRDTHSDKDSMGISGKCDYALPGSCQIQAKIQAQHKQVLRA